MTEEKAVAPFHAMAELKQIAPAKNINTKAGPPHRKICLPLNTSFLYKSKRLPKRPFLTMFHFLHLLLLKITNGSLCHHSFFLNTSSLD